MSENKHTPEPWPVFTDIATIITPDPNGTPVAILSWDDYIRARACVNACAGIPTEVIEQFDVLGAYQRIHDLEQQRDELLAALEKCRKELSAWMRDHGDDIATQEAVADARAAIASVKGGTANTAADGWIEWKGGACPVDGETIVQCKLREPEGANMKERKAKEWSWKHCSDFNKYDIIAYRVVKGGAA